MSGRTHRELAVGSHLISERWREGEKETKAGKTKDRERTGLETRRGPRAGEPWGSVGHSFRERP